jgi:hypothetical protein
MDIDVTETMDDKREKQTCFYCGKPGHVRKDCWKHISDEARGRKPQTQV